MPITGFSKARKIGMFFTDDCKIAIGKPIPDINGSSELVGTVINARKSASEIRIRFLDISVSVSDDRTTALLKMTASAVVCNHGRPGREIEAREVEIALVKINKIWKIREVITVKTLR